MRDLKEKIMETKAQIVPDQMFSMGGIVGLVNETESIMRFGTLPELYNFWRKFAEEMPDLEEVLETQDDCDNAILTFIYPDFGRLVICESLTFPLNFMYTEKKYENLWMPLIVLYPGKVYLVGACQSADIPDGYDRRKYTETFYNK